MGSRLRQGVEVPPLTRAELLAELAAVSVSPPGAGVGDVALLVSTPLGGDARVHL